jgi:hypothetical protein
MCNNSADSPAIKVHDIGMRSHDLGKCAAAVPSAQKGRCFRALSVKTGAQNTNLEDINILVSTYHVGSYTQSSLRDTNASTFKHAIQRQNRASRTQVHIEENHDAC